MPAERLFALQPPEKIVSLIPMDTRKINLGDTILGEIGAALKIVASKARATKPFPATTAEHPKLTVEDQRAASALMRVNHAGEISAQALYRGQAMVARDQALRQHLLEAADEEHDHLAWCETRLNELNSRPSLLSPIWYGGSFAIGALAGLAGDKISLGFVAETEHQVTAHLESHLRDLPADDHRSREVILQMRDDELRHSTHALEKGGAKLPTPIRACMSLTSKIMTTLAHRI
jgi:ubiquinone biosynthesis monooxygenase Coq7|tara:strand:- start:1842 stop:2543 length:702 start_codon:yes stop_codon:yes gene_type:complete